MADKNSQGNTFRQFFMGGGGEKGQNKRGCFTSGAACRSSKRMIRPAGTLVAFKASDHLRFDCTASEYHHPFPFEASAHINGFESTPLAFAVLMDRGGPRYLFCRSISLLSQTSGL